jgi:glycosyltransferase involved in cell wall biosynthesis
MGTKSAPTFRFSFASRQPPVMSATSFVTRPEPATLDGPAIARVPVRVLHVYAGNLFGGIETFLIALARLRGHCADMDPAYALCFEGRLADELRAAGAAVHSLGPARLSRPWTVWRVRRRLTELLRTGQWDVVATHGCWPHAVFAPAVRAAGTRLVNVVHDVLTRRNWIDWWAAQTRPDVVLANSRFTAGPAAELFCGVPVEVAYLPVAAPAVPDRDAARREIRAELGTPAGAVVVLQASRLERWKGQAVHLEALARLKSMPGWEAWFAGGPQKPGEAEYFQELKATAQREGLAGRVKFLGQRSDVARLMAAADVYCQPNAGPEPFGLAFVEALGAGLPVVTTGLGGALEIVDATCGVLLPTGDAPALAEHLARLIGDAGWRQQLGTGGPARAAMLCDPTKQMRWIGQVLRAAPGSVSVGSHAAHSANGDGDPH